MVIQKMTPNLLSLLEAHASVAPIEALTAPRPPNPIPYRQSLNESSKKKRKRDKRQGKKIAKKGELPD